MGLLETVAPLVAWLGVALVLWPRCAEVIITTVCSGILEADAADTAMGYFFGAIVASLWPLWVLPRLAYRQGLLETPTMRHRRRAEHIRELERELGLEPLESFHRESVAELWQRRVSTAGEKWRQL